MQQEEFWQKIEDLFNKAIHLSASSRIPFVLEQCGGGDEQICREVISLLAADSQSNEILNESVFPLVAHLLDEDLTELLEKNHFASYKLIKIIGRGGMGAVFLAKDLRLEREVALKILPSTTATNPESVLRFQQEAKAASAISHPHVAHVYEFGSHDGLYFLAMEYVDGTTMRELIADEKVDLKSAVEIAVHVAKALLAAHRIGVIHRDIKPENVIINEDHVCKVLDFGLAKLNEKKWRKGTNSLETVPGLIIGTSAYMSPEQVRGQIVDERTDIWSLGVCLYEMIAKKRPFDGETSSDIQAAILLKEPTPLSIAAELPELQNIVEKALKKNAAERYDSIRQMLDDLQSVQQRIINYLHDENFENSKKSLKQQFLFAIRQRTHLVGIFVSIFVAVIFIGSFLLTGFNNQKNDRSVAVNSVQRVTNSGKAIYTAVSPSGETAAFVLEEAGREALYLKSLNDSTKTAQLIIPPLTEKDGYVGVAFSPDNQFLYYAFKNDRITATLYKIAVTGGEPQKILDDIDSAPSFSPDGKQIVFLRIGANGGYEELVIANVDGDNEKVLFTRQMPDYIPHKATPAWSPDGQLVACPIGLQENGEKKVRLVGIRTSDGAIVPLSIDDWAQIAQVSWSDDQRSLTIVARRFEAKEEKQIWRVFHPSGEATALTDDPNDYEGVSTAQNGNSVLTIAIARKVDVWLIDYETPHQQPLQLTFGNDVANGVVWTSDNRIVYSSTASGNSDIWIMDSAGGNVQRLTNDPNADIQPIVSFDNRYIVFLSTRSGSHEIWRMDLDGKNQVQLTDRLAANTPTITADNKNVLFYAQTAGGSSLFRVSIEGGVPEMVYQGVRRFPTASPNGEWLVSSCRPNNVTKNKICISTINDISVFARVYEPEVGANSPSKLRWVGRDSRAFTYIVNTRGVENLWLQSVDGAPPKKFTNFNEDYIYAFDWSPDGKKLVCGRGNTNNNAVLLKLKN